MKSSNGSIPRRSNFSTQVQPLARALPRGARGSRGGGAQGGGRRAGRSRDGRALLRGAESRGGAAPARERFLSDAPDARPAGLNRPARTTSSQDRSCCTVYQKSRSEATDRIWLSSNLGRPIVDGRTPHERTRHRLRKKARSTVAPKRTAKKSDQRSSWRSADSRRSFNMVLVLSKHIIEYPIIIYYYSYCMLLSFSETSNFDFRSDRFSYVYVHLFRMCFYCSSIRLMRD